MYVYTDDDLTRINRDYLGPKGKRLPWVMPYRVYAVIFAVAFGWFGIFWFLQIPFNKWTVMFYAFAVAMTATFITRRLRKDVSLWAMFRAGWQEVVAPRRPVARLTPHQVAVRSIPMLSLNAEPTPKWWHFRARAALRSQRRQSKPKQRREVASSRKRNSHRS